jgi:hypothetical protein
VFPRSVILIVQELINFLCVALNFLNKMYVQSMYMKCVTNLILDLAHSVNNTRGRGSIVCFQSWTDNFQNPSITLRNDWLITSDQKLNDNWRPWAICTLETIEFIPWSLSSSSASIAAISTGHAEARTTHCKNEKLQAEPTWYDQWRCWRRLFKVLTWIAHTKLSKFRSGGRKKKIFEIDRGMY